MQFLVGQLDSVRLVQHVPVVIGHPVASSVVRKLTRIELKLGQGVLGANRRPQVKTNAAAILRMVLKIYSTQCFFKLVVFVDYFLQSGTSVSLLFQLSYGFGFQKKNLKIFRPKQLPKSSHDKIRNLRHRE